MYNSAPWIDQALGSALAQTVQDIEVIVVDDGSTDEGPVIVADRAQEDDRVKLVRQQNRGPSAARNVGIERATAAFVAFLDADDYWLPKKLERQLKVADTGVVYTDLTIVGEPTYAGVPASAHQELYEGLVFEHLARSNFIGTLTVLAPTELLRRYKFDESMRLAEDFDLWLRLSADDVLFTPIREPLAEYRITPGTPGRDSLGMIASRIAIFRKLDSIVTGERRELVRWRLAQERRVLASSLRRRALRGFASLDLRGGARNAIASLRT
jgi:glycosyltransferase involved in cell wall biosynthesis